MARKVFFSFHYKRDSRLVSQIRNCRSIASYEKSTFLDKAEWESIENAGKLAVRNWIDKNMYGTSVVVVLMGAETAGREWVQYEIKKAHTEKRGIVCVDMTGMNDMGVVYNIQGYNPLRYVNDANGNSLYTLGKYKTYSWVNNDGYNMIDDWIEEAAKNAGY